MLACFRRIHLGHIQLEELSHSLLDQLPERPLKAQGYGPANLVTLLYMLRGLSKRDWSHDRCYPLLKAVGRGRGTGKSK